MAVAEDARVQLSVRFGLLLPHLNERQRRLLLATEARLLGMGACARSPRWSGSARPPSARACWSWTRARATARGSRQAAGWWTQAG